MLYVVCYDISSDKRRTKVANLLLDHGVRIQESAFECDLKDDAEVEKVVGRALRLIDQDSDTVRCYRICGACRGEKKLLGIDRVPQIGAATVLG